MAGGQLTELLQDRVCSATAVRLLYVQSLTFSSGQPQLRLQLLLLLVSSVTHDGVFAVQVTSRVDSGQSLLFT